jgi:ParB-like chromosome segregation protein Spo0J
MSREEKRIKWHIEKREIEKLRPYEKNPRIIEESGLKQLAESFDEIGYAQPININVDGTILSGHARYMQLKKENAIGIDVYVPDRKLTPKQEEAVIIRMNKNHAGTWDLEKLNLDFERDDLINWGFKEDELNLGKLDLKVDEIDLQSNDDNRKKFLVEVQFPNEMEMMDIYDDLISRGYMARIKK